MARIHLLRLGVLSLLLMLNLFLGIWAQESFQPKPVYFVILVSLVLALVWRSLAVRCSLSVNHTLSLILDLTSISALVYTTGAVLSPYHFLFVLPPVYAARHLGQRQVYLLAVLGFLIFGVMSDLVFLGIVPLYVLAGEPEVPGFGALISNLVLSFVVLSMTSVLALHSFETLRRKVEQLDSMQENLRDLVLLNQTVLDRMQGGYLVADQKGHIISCNRQAGRILGFREGENLGDILGSWGHLDEWLTGRDLHAYLELNRGGKSLGVDLSRVPGVYSYPEVLVMLIQDRSQEIQIRQELEEQRDLALIGEMTASIAHEIRNPLASISGAVQYLSRSNDLSESHLRLMNIIRSESDRLAASVGSLLNFARPLPFSQGRVQLDVLLDEVVDLLQTAHPELVVDKKYPQGVVLEADGVQLRQLVWNLLVNSVKASVATGRIEVVYDVECSVLKIRDHGVGMDQETVRRVFEPFFSGFTSGIGLGMAMVRRVADSHGYRLEVDSEKGKGTEVRVWMG